MASHADGADGAVRAVLAAPAGALAALVRRVVEPDDAHRAVARLEDAVLAQLQTQALLGLRVEHELRARVQREVAHAGAQAIVGVEALFHSRGHDGGVHVVGRAFHERSGAGVGQRAVELVGVGGQRGGVVGADGHGHERAVRSAAQALVDALAVEHHHGAHQLDGRLRVLGRQRADGGVEQLVHAPRVVGRQARLDCGVHAGRRLDAEGVAVDRFRAERGQRFGCELRKRLRALERLDGAGDFYDLPYRSGHGMLLRAGFLAVKIIEQRRRGLTGYFAASVRF